MKKQVSLIMLGLLLISMMAFLPNFANAYTYADYKASIVKTADRLVALQCVATPPTPADYGWDWIVTGLTSHSTDPSAYNLFGVTAIGLVDAYLITGTAAYLTAAKKTADFMEQGDPSAGGFHNGHDGFGWGYSFDYRFLMQFSTVYGNVAYKNYAVAAWAWQRARPLYATGNEAAFFNYFVTVAGIGYAGWGASDYGLAAWEMGDTVWAQNLASVVNGNIPNISGATDCKDLGMAWALKFLLTVDPVGYASGIATLKTNLKNDQNIAGYWHDLNPDGDVQTTAYSVMALWAAGELTAARKGADWLVANQLANGGWSASPTEYSESDSEGMQALSAAIASASTLYIDPSSVTKTPSDVGTNFTVAVTLSNFGNLMGFDIKLTWDGSLLSNGQIDKTPLNALWPGGWANVFDQSGAGFYEFAASSISTAASNAGASVLFTVTFKILKSGNFPLSTPIHFAVVKLSDNTTPIPNPIVPTTVTDGLFTISGTKPDIEFEVLKQNKKTLAYEPVILPDHFEYCNYFVVNVYVTHIFANSSLTDYDVTIDFDPGLAAYVGIDAWGVLGTGTAVYTSGTPNVIHVTGIGGPWSGDKGLLFTLKFHVEFSCIPAHIWKNGNANYMTFQVWLADVTLSFGTDHISMGGINTPSPLIFEVDFIRGDVDCNGVVNMADISDVAFYYGLPASAKPEYDLTNDGVIDIYDIVTIGTNYGYGMDP